MPDPAARDPAAGRACGPVQERSFAPLTAADLGRCADLALADLAGLFARRPETGRCYRGRLLILCLCQGAAEHFLRGRHGVKDLDVWAFFAAHPDRPFPHRRRGRCDFGPSRLGRHPGDAGFAGRRVDVLGRSLACPPDADPQQAVRDWLDGGRTESARLLALRPVIVLHPRDQLGAVIRDPGDPAGRVPAPGPGCPRLMPR